MKSLNDKLDEIEKRADAATEGPWSISWGEFGGHPGMFGIWSAKKKQNLFAGFSHTQEQDFLFSSNARTDLPKLLKALKLSVGALEEFAKKEWETVTPETSQSALTEINQIFETGEKSK